SNTLTVMRRRPGEANAVPSRRTLRIGSGNRYLLRPHGAFAMVRMDFDDIGLSPKSPQVSSFEGRRPAGIPTWAARAYNRADAHMSSPVFVDLDCDDGDENLWHSTCPVSNPMYPKRATTKTGSFRPTLKMLAKPL